MRNKIIPPTALAARIGLVLMLIVVVCGVASAECDPETAWDSYPKLPMGCEPTDVWIDGQLAPIGTFISFSGENVRDEGYMYLEEEGGLGKWGFLTRKLMIQGMQSPDQCGMLNIPDDAPITFYVNDVPAKVRIDKGLGCGGANDNSDATWYDTIPWQSGATVEIQLKVGDVETLEMRASDIPVVLTGPCPNYSNEWTEEDRKWITKWESGSKTHEVCTCNGEFASCHMESEKQFLADEFNAIRGMWFSPNYTHEQTDEKFQRQVFYAEHGGYGCHPNLTLMVDANGWRLMYTSYGWPYSIGSFGWSRVTTTVYQENDLPSLFIPPLRDPILVNNGYPPSLAAGHTPEPTPTPTPTITPEPTTEPLLFTHILMQSGDVGAEAVVEPTITYTPTPTPTPVLTPVPTQAPTVTAVYVPEAPVGEPGMPSIPMSVECSSITLAGVPAPAGTVVRAVGTNVYSGSSVTMGNAGGWTSDTPLVIQGIPVKGVGQYTIPANSPIMFMAGEMGLKVRIIGASVWQDSIPYRSGDAVSVELSAGATGGSVPTMTPTPTQTTVRRVSSGGGGGGGSGTYVVSSQPLVEPTTTPAPTPTVTLPVTGTPVITPVPTTTWSETYITPVTYTRVLRLPSPNNVAIYYSNLPLPDCDSEELYVPAGYGVLRVSAGSSEGQFYLNDALITNGGVTILKGVPAGEYTITFRERYYDTEQFVVPIRSDCVTNVEVTPEGPGLLGIIGWPPDWLLDVAPSLSENVDFWYEDLPEPKPSTGSFQIMTWWDGTDVFLDGQFFVAGCDIPCDFTFHGIEPGIHHITYVTDQYESTFPVIIGAGTLTKIGGGAAVQGRDSSGQYIPVNPWDLYEGPE